jgi:TatD DNase family protein
MTFLDIHTHNNAAGNTIFSSGTLYLAERRISVGIHPWYINADWKNDLAAIAGFANESNVAAIGECGIDTLKSPAPVELQEDIFKAHIMLAEEVQKPLILHCVKAYDRLVALRNGLKPQQAWIIHGFRGKPQQAEQLIKAGFHISLCEKFNPDSARIIPADRLFIESDESNAAIADIYAAVACAKGADIEALAVQTVQNAAMCGIIL